MKKFEIQDELFKNYDSESKCFIVDSKALDDWEY